VRAEESEKISDLFKNYQGIEFINQKGFQLWVKNPQTAKVVLCQTLRGIQGHRDKG
jgi:hypothetical protein